MSAKNPLLDTCNDPDWHLVKCHCKPRQYEVQGYSAEAGWKRSNQCPDTYPTYEYAADAMQGMIAGGYGSKYVRVVEVSDTKTQCRHVHPAFNDTCAKDYGHDGMHDYRGPAKNTVLKDIKAALNSSVKPDITHVRTPLLNYVARNCEYGNDKYERANYIRPTDSHASDFKRYRAYLRALVSHTVQVLDSMERHQANDPLLQDLEGMKKACYAIDTDPDTSGKAGPSLLSHIGGAAASLNMALEQAVTAGLLPVDPGTPWKTNGNKSS